MTINVVLTKVIIPKRPPSVVRRSRLVDYLHEHLERKLLLVTAPAGYGKTTLLIDFAGDADLPVCWYTLDEGDRDPGTFIAHLIAALQHTFPDFGTRSKSLLEHGLPAARAVATALVNDMVEDIPDYFILILDDWHLVGEEAEIRAILDQLLKYIPEHAHLIIAGRALPRGPLVRLAARSAVAGLGSNDLRFTVDEVREVLSNQYDTQITEEQAQALVEQSEGWITAILLTTQGMWRGLLADLVTARDTSGPLYDYLAGEVFERLSEGLRRFLLESAITRQFTISLCDQLRDTSDTLARIEQVEAQNLYLTRVETDDELWYRYHHLFRDFLLARFKQDDPDGFKRLHLRSAEVFEARRQFEEAVEHYLAADALEHAARMMNATARSLYINGRTQTILNWAELLPEALRLTAPKLVIFQGKVMADLGRPAEALPLFEQAEKGFRRYNDALGQIHAVMGKGWAHYARGRLRDALSTGKDVLKRLTELEEDDPLQKAHALRLIGTTYSGMGQWQSGEQHLAQALALFRRSDSDESRAYDLGRTLNDLAYTLRFMGRLEEAAAHQAESLLYWREVGNPGLVAWSLNNIGYDHFLVGEYEKALTFYTEALSKAEEADDKRAQGWVLDGIAAAHRDRGEFQDAIKTYEKVFGVANEIGDQTLVSWALDGKGHAHRLSGDHDRALSLFEQAHSLAEREEIGPQATLSTASIGIVNVENDSIADGIADLKQATDALSHADSHLDLARVLFWLARAYFENGQESLAKENLAEMVRLGSRLGCRPFSLVEGRRAKAFLRWGAKQLASDARLQNWINELYTDADAEQIEVVAEQPAIPRIEVRTFGSGRVWRDGRMLVVADWGAAIVRELFYYLLECLPQRKEEIGAVFWPDLSPARMTSVFHATKYKARRALGADFVLYEDEVYRLDAEADIWLDVNEFQRLLDSARRRAPDDPARLSELERAVELYEGDYLTESYADWVLEKRQIFQARFFDALIQLIDLLLARHELDRVLELSRRGLAYDFYREDLHRHVIRCLSETGRQSEAIAYYKTLSQRFEKELDVAPARATRELVEQIRLEH